MKLAELVYVYVFLKEDKHFSRKQGQNFIVDMSCYWAHAVQHICKFMFVYFFCCVVCKQVTEHVIILKEIFDKHDGIQQFLQ